jgi:hypothetical protein
MSVITCNLSAHNVMQSKTHPWWHSIGRFKGLLIASIAGRVLSAWHNTFAPQHCHTHCMCRNRDHLELF